MNRSLSETASLLGLRKLTLRQKLITLKLLTPQGEIAPKYRERGLLIADARSYWNTGKNGWKHYSVILVTEKGLDVIAGKLGMEIRRMPQKDSAA